MQLSNNAHATSKNVHHAYLAGLVVTDAVFFSRTDPTEVSSYLLIVAFLLIALTTYMAVVHALQLAAWYGVKAGKHSKRIALIITGMTAALLAMRSVDQLGGKDMLVLVPIIAISYFYIHYARQQQREP